MVIYLQITSVIYTLDQNLACSPHYVRVIKFTNVCIVRIDIVYCLQSHAPSTVIVYPVKYIVPMKATLIIFIEPGKSFI